MRRAIGHSLLRAAGYRYEPSSAPVRWNHRGCVSIPEFGATPRSTPTNWALLGVGLLLAIYVIRG